MKCIEIIKNIESWAPREIAWQKDNSGLQIGDTEKRILNILVCLEINDNVVNEALKKKCNLIISHHPFFFSPLKKIDIAKDRNSRLIQNLIKHDMVLYSAHTNLDYTKEGVSYQLARILELRDINFLANLKSNQYKLSVFVPENYCDAVANAIFNAGGGIIGDYTKCSFSTRGNGSFHGSENTNPAIEENEIFNSFNEIKLEVLLDRWKLNKVISEIKKVHPYEEVAYDVVPLDNPNVNYGIGAIGYLDKEYNLNEFLSHVKNRLQITNFRYTNGNKKKIRKVAVCGGSGSEYFNDAVAQNCDAYITADIKYHSFQEAKGEILLIDAGHYETEIFSLKEIKKRITLQLNNNNDIKVYLYSGSTNPVIFYNN
ncbi:MAG: Nif3-like dinuclear metal center hexameric protein [Ignavibacteriaceae bacterium]|nr:Nif3-like dinuclear metal center hexameric protein [Ignavibacteriaceae bacterium]